MSGDAIDTGTSRRLVRRSLPPGPQVPAWIGGPMFASDPVGVMQRARRSYGPVFTLQLPGIGACVVICDAAAAITLLNEPLVSNLSGPAGTTALPVRRLRSQRIVARRILPAGTIVLLPLILIENQPGTDRSRVTRPS